MLTSSVDGTSFFLSHFSTMISSRTCIPKKDKASKLHHNVSQRHIGPDTERLDKDNQQTAQRLVQRVNEKLENFH